VDFDDIAGRVAMMAGEVSALEARVTPSLRGEFGMMPSAIATPLALVLTELLQNALQHGFSRPCADPAVHDGAMRNGTVLVTAQREAERLTVSVADNGTGLPEDFDLEQTTSLGLQIVRTLVVGELGGRLEIGPHDGGGTLVRVELPIKSLAAGVGAGVTRLHQLGDARRWG
jgi:two-component sensor histidine kinase